MRKIEPEFSRPLEVNRVPTGGSMEKLGADTRELAALARRLGIERMNGFSGELKVMPWRGGLHVTGVMTADLDRVSVVSLQSFRAIQEISIDRYFLPPSAISSADDDEADPIENGVVDLGEAAAEALALDLDPYPRKPGEAFEGADQTEHERQPSPFEKLAKIIPKNP
jgi:hypothetical protein